MAATEMSDHCMFVPRTACRSGFRDTVRYQELRLGYEFRIVQPKKIFKERASIINTIERLFFIPFL